MLRKAVKYRIYPTKEQEILINKTIGASRFIYNKMLIDKKNYYKQYKKSLYVKPSDYKKDYEWLNEVDSLALTNAWTNLNTAYRNFYSKRSKYPKVKKKKKCKWTYQTNNQRNSIRIEGNMIRLPKLGFVTIKYHRQLPSNSTIKTVTVTKTRTNKYYVSVLVEYDNQILKSIPNKNNVLGLDYSMSDLYVDSNGNKAPNFVDYDALNAKKLARASRRLARKQKGSNRRKKQALKVAKIHEKIHNQKIDYLHKLTKMLADTYDCVAIEDISVKEMSKKKKGNKFSFGKSVKKNSWGTFITFLTYKLEWNGREIYKVDKWYASSQICNNCKTKNPQVKNLSVRQWTCPTCGAFHDRDVNAAKNIRDEAIRNI